MIKTIRTPAEWEKQQGVLLAWPYNKNDWPGKIHSIYGVYQEIIQAITEHEKVFLIVQSEKHQEFVQSLLKKYPIDLLQIEWIIQKTNRSWMRDTSAIFSYDENNQLIANNFKFNGWAKYSNYKLDQNIPTKIAEVLNISQRQVLYNNNKPVVLEGGAIDTNGKGTLITTEECLLSEDKQIRNKNFTKETYASIFQEYLGITNILWLKKGILGDDTHGHIDDLCRFVNSDTVVIASVDDPQDPHYLLLKENMEILQNSKLEDGSKLNIIKLPMPHSVYYEGMLLPASYANFLITNHVVLVPTFNDESDPYVLSLFKELFPQRKVIGIHAVDLVWGLGTIHCSSHEIPH
jgi:agmatine deiminase